MSIFDSLFRRTAGPVLGTYLGRSGDGSVYRLYRGDPDSRQPVPGCIVLHDNADVTRVSNESGYMTSGEGEEFIELAVLEVPIAETVDELDEWLFEEAVWKQVGGVNGRDAAYQTLLVRNISRINGGAANARKR